MNELRMATDPKLFDDGELYTIAEIADRMKCGYDTVDRKMKKHKVPAVRFGARKFWGREINRIIAAETRPD